MFKLLFRDDANADIQETVAYYNLLPEGLTDSFLEELGAAILKLGASPQSYSYLSADMGLRFLRMKKISFQHCF